ncbi:Calsyntenin-1-like protein, partial [Leptotrombidium deliense]
PRLESVGEDGYRAVVNENERTVIVTPRIKVVDARVCSIEVVNKHHGEVPFEVRIVDQENGEAILEAKRELNCEKRRTYKFSIRAIGCNKLHSQNASVHLTVEDVNEYAPMFRKESYTVTINEGRLVDPIVQVEAVDHDCSPKYSKICKYEIIAGDKLAAPFEIDGNGNIKNTQPLSWKISHNYILEIVAYDCGMKRSKPVLVNIKVNKVCQVGWKEIPERIEYIPGSAQRVLFPDAELQLCDVPCDTENVSVRVSLATHHIGKGCDRDTYSVASQRKLCGASDESVDLLPSPGIGTEWTRDLPTDEGHESDQIYEFDGATNSVVIQESTLHHNLTDNFTIAFWMKHEPPADHNNKHIKEHIICNADDHKKNRHHYALFVRNCRLILLLRREYNQEKHTVFKPAEWRWKLAEVCDNEWHHYAVIVNFPDVILFVDGQRFKNSSNNPEIVDDWPLHAMKDVNTTLVVGACWEGKSSKMNFHFRGFLAGLSILRGKSENPDVLACLHRCKEGLQLPPSDTLDPGTELSINSDATEIVVEGKDAIDVEDMLSQISYLNSREFPTPGRRSLRISTSIKCISGKSLKIPAGDSYIMVLPPEQPSITLNGTPNLAREYEAFVQGIELFSTVSVLVNHELEPEDDQQADSENERVSAINKLMNGHKLDTCTVQVYPPLNPDHEYFRLPINFMKHLGVRHKETKDGIVIYGADTVHNYQSILRQIVYFNRKPAYYLNRAFKLTCSELNGRFVSNDYIQTLTVIHPKSDSQATLSQKHSINSIEHSGHQSVAHVQIHEHKVEFKQSQIKNAAPGFLDNGLLESADAIGHSSPMTSRLSPIVVGHAVTVIIVVCVGFLVFMIVLGVIRIRAAHRRSNESRDEDQEMAWDDSSLTITVNPLDQIDREHESHPLHDEEEESDSSDDGSSYHEDGESSEDETEKAKARRELEWDDSTLTF